jgi:YfiH family protein
METAVDVQRLGMTEVATGDAGFRWDESGAVRFLSSLALTPHARHGYTTRELRFRDAAAEDRQRLAEVLGVEAGGVVMVRQVHGRDVAVVKPGSLWSDSTPADAVVSTDPSRAIAIQVADCVPLLLADTGHRVVAAVHAGWRGTVADVTGATIDTVTAMGIDPGTLVAAIGPSIGGCCYQVDARVRDAFLSANPGAAEWFTEDGAARWKLDLWRANVAALESRGVRRDAISVAGICTADHPKECFSYRREGPGTGRMVAAIRLRGPSG